MSDNLPRIGRQNASNNSYLQRLISGAYNPETIDAELKNIQRKFESEDRRIIWFIASIITMLLVTLVIFLVYFYNPSQPVPPSDQMPLPL